MAILTIDFDEDEHQALDWIIDTFRSSLERGDWDIPNDVREDVMPLMRSMHEAVRSWNHNDEEQPRIYNSVEDVEDFIDTDLQI